MKVLITVSSCLVTLLFASSSFAHPPQTIACQASIESCLSAKPTVFLQTKLQHQMQKTFFKQKKKRNSHGRSRSYHMPSTIGHSGKTFIFDPSKLMWGAYSGGKLVKKGRASGGKSYCPDIGRRCLTPRGNFRIYHKGPASCKSTRYPRPRGGAPMPYCMFFHGNYAIHGSPHVPNYNASHGCIRVPPADAKWLHRNFMSHGTRVIVKSY